MSGGSFNYLYSNYDSADWVGAVRRMVQHCLRVGPKNVGEKIFDPQIEDCREATFEDVVVVRFVGELLSAVADKCERANDAVNEVRPLMKAVEWWVSGDTGWYGVADAYREMMREED